MRLILKGIIITYKIGYYFSPKKRKLSNVSFHKLFYKTLRVIYSFLGLRPFMEWDSRIISAISWFHFISVMHNLAMDSKMNKIVSHFYFSYEDFQIILPTDKMRRILAPSLKNVTQLKNK